MRKNMRKTSMTRYIAQLGRYAIPFYPLFKTYTSLKRTLGTGRDAWHSLKCPSPSVVVDKDHEDQPAADLKPEAKQLPQPRILTFRQALAQRSADAISVEAVERLCLARKRAALAGGFLCLCFSCGSAFGGNYIGSLLGLLSVCLCFLFVVKHDHRLWQIETGRQNPDQMLGNFRAFFAVPGVFLRLLDPRFFR